MKTKDLLKLIEMARHVEEEAVASLSEQVSAATEWLSGTKEEMATVKDGLKILEKESKQHAKTLDALEKLIKKEGRDVY